MKYYKVDIRNIQIDEINVDREMPGYVYINGTAVAREQVGFMYYPTREEAKEMLITYYDGMKQGLELRLNFTKQKIDQAKAL